MGTDRPFVSQHIQQARYSKLRRQMVDDQLRRRNVTDERVLEAMGQVPRHAFVGASLRDEAYRDHPLPIGESQTISQPYMVARMTELCAPTPRCRALEVGAGCGYQTAVLASLCHHVHAVEYIQDLADGCRQNLQRLGFDNVTVRQGDGTLGWPEHQPFDIILVAAAAPRVPGPLLEQLADGGRLVVPTGGKTVQTLQRITRRGDDLSTRDDLACRFVRLRGEHGWD